MQAEARFAPGTAVVVAIPLQSTVETEREVIAMFAYFETTLTWTELAKRTYPAR
jgi:hypothetical protein